MPKFQIAIFAAALTLASAAPAFGDGYREVRKVYRYAPVPEVVEAPDNGKVIYSYTEVRIRYRGAPTIDHGIAYFNGPPELWRQREVAYDAIFTQDKRIIYDAGRAAQTRAFTKGYAPRWYYAPPPAGIAEPIFDPAGTCGTFRYWNGADCVDARYYSRYKNPYKW